MRHNMQKTISQNTAAIQYLCSTDSRLAQAIQMIGPITYSTHDNNPYAFIVHEIIEQMLSIKAGKKIYDRLEIICDGTITPTSVNQLTDEQLRSTGTSIAKVGYIRNLTTAILSKSIILDELTSLPDDIVINKLTSIKGIGIWTAKMYLIFVLDRQDVLPYEDGAFIQAFRWLYGYKTVSKNTIVKHTKKWSPYSSIAARYCYKALDMGYTRNRIKPGDNQ